MNIKDLLNKRMTENAKFMGQTVEIHKLSVSEVMEIQELAKELEANPEKGFDVLKRVIKLGTKDAEDLTDEDFNRAPLDELSKLANSIMKHSGIGADLGKGS
jgi:pterin-4a-carbinolamine dehydratase